MTRKIFTAMFAGILMVTLALPWAAHARGFAGQGCGRVYQNHTRNHHQHHFQDGSCLNPNGSRMVSMNNRGNRFGPGNGSGNAGAGPKDGTGYGAPSNR
jgi:hypothetical protein